MAETSKFEQSLDGVQRLYFEENGQRLAVITAMAQRHLQGAHISLSTAPVVDGRCLGLAVCQLGYSVLRMAGCWDDDTLRHMNADLEACAMPEGTVPLEDDDIPF